VIFFFSLILVFRQNLKFEIVSLLGYNAAQTGCYIPTFPMNLSAPVSKVGRIIYSENRVIATNLAFVTSQKKEEKSILDSLCTWLLM
jgi:hypothetical protein